jgi:hypothetical protein
MGLLIETGVKTVVKSAWGLGDAAGIGAASGAGGALSIVTGGASAPLSDWNICVKLPGLPVERAAAGGACGGGWTGVSGGLLLAGVDSARSKDWSKSSCSGECAACGATLANIPVALVDSFAEDSPGPEKLELSNGDSDESMLYAPLLLNCVVVLVS